MTMQRLQLCSFPLVKPLVNKKCITVYTSIIHVIIVPVKTETSLSSFTCITYNIVVGLGILVEVGMEVVLGPQDKGLLGDMPAVGKVQLEGL